MRHQSSFSRREFLSSAVGAICALTAAGAEKEGSAGVSPHQAEPIIDIHQHTNYSGRTDDRLIAHQEAMGVTQTILLPAGRYYGLDAQCGGNDTCVAIAQRYRGKYFFFANEMPYLAEADATIRKYLKAGGIGIGEQKFRVMSDSGHIDKIAKIAQEFGVPVLMHFQETDYNLEFNRFYKTLEKWPKVNFIGHAQTFWAHIDKNFQGGVLYPKGPVTAGGLTDKYLSDYPNMFGDLSAGSGLGAALRDEEHYKGFIERHQDKLLYGSDCNDTAGHGATCSGAQMIATVRRLTPTKAIEQKLLYKNARKMFRLG